MKKSQKKLQDPEKFTQKVSMVTPDDLLHQEVFNKNGEKLGEIENIVIDLEKNRIACGILSFDGAFGIGEQHYAIPWDALLYDKENKQFVVDIPKEKLEQAEPFTKDMYPAVTNPIWMTRLYGYYGYPPY